MAEREIGKLPWTRILGASALLFCLIVFLPYRPPATDGLVEPNGLAFSPNLGLFLKYRFERGRPSLSERLGAKRLEFQVKYGRAEILRPEPDGMRKLFIIRRGGNIGRSVAFGRLEILEPLSPALRAAVLLALEHPERDAARWLPESKRRLRLFGRWRTSDLYTHGIMLLLVTQFAFLFVFGWRGRIGRKDFSMALPLLLGVVTVFFLTDAAPGDIKLHFYNEARQSYRWDLYGPGGFAWQKALFRLFGTSDAVLFTANRVLGILIALPLAVYARERLESLPAGIWAGILLLASPVWLRYAASDLTHPYAFFLFFSSVALLAGKKAPDTPSILFAFSGLALAMLGRGEFFVLGPLAPLLLGWKRTLDISRKNPGAVAAGIVLCAALVLPQAVMLRGFVETDPEKLVRFSLAAAVKSWFWLDAGNTFADERFSPVVQMALAAAGFLLMLVRKPFVALAFFVSAAAFLWNPYIFRPEFSSTHYQLPIWPFYLLLAGFGPAMLQKAAKLRLPPRLYRAALIALGLWIVAASLSGYGPMLRGDRTYMEFYRFLRLHRDAVPPGCDLIYVRPGGDHDLYNLEQVWFDAPGPPSSATNTLRRPPPENGDCRVYLRVPACRVASPRDPKRFLRRCERFESAFGMEPLAEGLLNARAVCNEVYLSDPLPVGFFRMNEKK